MANTRFSVTEAVNVNTTYGWNRLEGFDSSSEKYWLLSKDANVLVIYTDKQIYIEFTLDSENAIETNDSIKVAAGWHSINVPRGLGDTIYLHLKSTSGNAKLRVVEG